MTARLPAATPAAAARPVPAVALTPVALTLVALTAVATAALVPGRILLPVTVPGGGARRDRIPAGHGKFCADELAVALAISRWPAERMLALARDLATRLPSTRRALHEGVIDAYKAQIIAEATRVLDDAAAAAAEAAVIPTGRRERHRGSYVPRSPARSSKPTRARPGYAGSRRSGTHGWNCGVKMPGPRRCAGSGLPPTRRWPLISGSLTAPLS